MKKHSLNRRSTPIRGFFFVCSVAIGMFVSLVPSAAEAQLFGYEAGPSYPIIEAHGIQPHYGSPQVFGGQPSYSSTPVYGNPGPSYGGPAYGTNPGFSPIILPRGEYRDALKATPIEARPYRPFHFYGNAVRRNYYRNQAIQGGVAPMYDSGVSQGAW